MSDAYQSAYQLECEPDEDAPFSDELMRLIWEAFGRSAPDNTDSAVSP